MGSNNLLENKKILVIKTEAFFFSIYENKSPTLADQMTFLKSKGYRMIYLDFDRKGYLLDGIKFPLSCDKRPILWGDAYFIPDFQNIELSAEKCLRLSLMLSALKFNSLAKYFLLRSKIISPERVEIFFRFILKKNFKLRVKDYWNNLPTTLNSTLKEIFRY